MHLNQLVMVNYQLKNIFHASSWEKHMLIDAKSKSYTIIHANVTCELTNAYIKKLCSNAFLQITSSLCAITNRLPYVGIFGRNRKYSTINCRNNSRKNASHMVNNEQQKMQNFSIQISKAHEATVPVEKLVQQRKYPYTLAHQSAFQYIWSASNSQQQIK